MAKDKIVKIAVEVQENFTDSMGDRHTKGEIAFFESKFVTKYIKEGLVIEQEFDLGNESAKVDMSEFIEIEMYRELSDKTQVILKENQELKNEIKQLKVDKDKVDKELKIEKEKNKEKKVEEAPKLEKEKKTSKAKK